jgi:hypothetical protein
VTSTELGAGGGHGAGAGAATGAAVRPHPGGPDAMRRGFRPRPGRLPPASAARSHSARPTLDLT